MRARRLVVVATALVVLGGVTATQAHASYSANEHGHTGSCHFTVWYATPVSSCSALIQRGTVHDVKVWYDGTLRGWDWKRCYDSRGVWPNKTFAWLCPTHAVAFPYPWSTKCYPPGTVWA